MKNLIKIFMITFMFSPANLSAKIYCCKTASGSTIYQEFPCVGSLSSLKVLDLPIRSKETISQKNIRKKRELESLRKANNFYQKQHKGKAKQSERFQKQRIRGTKTKERRIMRCEQVKAKISLLESRLRDGYTERQGKSIRRKLAEYQILAKNYCYEC